ncbi:MAG: YbaN family protein [Acidimicrobiia bacterium]
MSEVGSGRTRPWLRPVYAVAGILCTGVGIVGMFLPLIPTTRPLLLATFFFARSSPRLHTWLVTHKRFGRFISDFHEGRGIPLRGKIVATIAMTVAFSYTIYFRLPSRWLQVVAAAIGGWALWFVHKYPTAPRERV